MRHQSIGGANHAVLTLVPYDAARCLPFTLFLERGLTLLHLSICGVPLVTRHSDGEIVPLSPKRLLFLSFLAAHAPHGVPRERVLQAFWPESTEWDARNALKQIIFALRRSVGGRLLLSSTTVALLPDAIRCDLWDVREAVRQRHHQQVLELVRGPFLDGVEAWQSAPLDQWIVAQRANVARWHAEASDATVLR